MAGFDNDIMYADNVDFRGVKPRAGQVTLNGQLLIGSTASPNIKVGTLTAGTGISVTNGSGSITIAATTGGVTSVTGTANQITASPTTGAVVLSLPVTVIAPGSVEATTFVQADTNFLLPTTSATAGTLKINNVVFISNPGGASGNSFLGGAGNLTISGNQTNGSGWAALASASSGSRNTATGYAALFSNSTNDDSSAFGANCLTTSTGSGSTAMGSSAGASITTNGSVSFFGAKSGQFSIGSNNTAVGFQSFINSTGANNTAIGFEALYSGINVLSGASNIAVGNLAGSQFTSTEASNIDIGNTGTVADSNIIRIGTAGSGAGQQNKCFIAGITGVTPAAASKGVIIDSNGQLGTSSATPDTTWSNISASQTMAVNHGYQCTGGAALALLLPATSAIGDILEVTLDGSTSWQVTQAAGQAIRMGSSVTTGGAGGSLTSTAQGDSIRMVCSVANLRWNVLSSIGNITLV